MLNLIKYPNYSNYIDIQISPYGFELYGFEQKNKIHYKPIRCNSCAGRNPFERKLLWIPHHTSTSLSIRAE